MSITWPHALLIVAFLALVFAFIAGAVSVGVRLGGRRRDPS